MIDVDFKGQGTEAKSNFGKCKTHSRNDCCGCGSNQLKNGATVQGTQGTHRYCKNCKND